MYRRVARAAVKYALSLTQVHEEIWQALQQSKLVLYGEGGAHMTLTRRQRAGARTGRAASPGSVPAAAHAVPADGDAARRV